MNQSHNLDKELLERLAELEHIQWTAFSKHVYQLVHQSKSIEALEQELFAKWNKNWILYRELPEGEKTKDRKWASKAVEIFSNWANAKDKKSKE